MSPVRNNRAERPAGRETRGFTLIELLAVLVIAISIVAIAVPRFSRAVVGVELHQATRDVAAFLRLSRNAAIAYASPVRVEVDPRRGSIRGAGINRSYDLPGHVDLALPTRRFGDRDEPYVIAFNADGTSSGGLLQLSADERSRQISVDWLTGRVRID